MRLNKPRELADRVAELRRVIPLITDPSPRFRCAVLKGGPATGITYFGRTLSRQSPKNTLLHYSDLNRDSDDLANLLLGGIAQSSWRGRLQVALARRGATALISDLLLRTLPFLSIPVPTAPMGLLENLPPVYPSRFPSLPVEVLARTLKGKIWRTPRIVLFVDNAQSSSAALHEILSGLHADVYSSLRFVLFYVERDKHDLSYEEWVQRVRASGMPLIEAEFSAPDACLVEEYAHLQDLWLEREKCAEIAASAKGNIYRIVNALRGDVLQSGNPEAEKYILAVLAAAHQPLRRSDVRLLVLTTPLVYLKEESDFDHILQHLKAIGMVTETALDDADTLLTLLPDPSSILRELGQSETYGLAVAGEIYSYFSRALKLSTRHSEAAAMKLLYRLAHSVDREMIPDYAQRLVTLALGQGSTVTARQYINDAVGGRPQGLADLYVRVALLLSLQEYSAAAACFDSVNPSIWRGTRIMRLFHAVVQNRLRSHIKALEAIDSLLAEQVSLEERTILISYKISTMLHDCRYIEAKKVLEKELERLRGAANFEYFLRNGAAVFLWGSERDIEKAGTLLDVALTSFEAKKDWFGYYTTLSNRGTVSAYQGASRSALVCFQSAFDSLSIYGTHHLEECGFNLAATLALAGDREQAARKARQMTAYFEKGNFPLLQLRGLTAVLWAHKGSHEDAVNEMEIAREEATLCDLTEAQFYVHYNSALVAFLQQDTARWRDYLKEAERTGFNGGSDLISRLEQAIEAGTVRQSTAIDFYGFDYHQYWSQNPFEMIPLHGLPL